MSLQLLLLTIWFIAIGVQAQPQRSRAKNYVPPSMLVGEESIFSLSDNGKFSIWSLATLDRKFQSDTLHDYTAIAKDNDNNIFLGTDKGQIFKLDQESFTLKEITQIKGQGPIHHLFFNSRNEIFAIIEYAVYSPATHRKWKNFPITNSAGIGMRKRNLLLQEKWKKKFLIIPDYVFVDNNEKVWFIKHFGEWGGSIQMFDAKNRHMIKPMIDGINYGLIFPQSVFEDDEKNIYITSGLQHFGNTGQIIRIKNYRNTSVIFDGDDFADTTSFNIFNLFDRGIFVGPGAINRKDGKIYFATTKGIFKADIPSSGRIYKTELVVYPSLAWTSEPMAIGVRMSIKRMTFTNDNRLVFLTSSDGIGVYDGQKLVMLK